MAGTKAASNLPGSPGGYFNRDMSPVRLLGLTPGTGSKAAGQQLPPTSHQSGDRGAVWWSPDSPQFWLIAFAGGALLGVAGLSVKFRAGPARAGASLGTT
jgi:hypothetical protein